MTGFLGQLGKNLADKWLSLMAVPGALYLAVLLTARALGQSHTFDVNTLTTSFTGWAKGFSVSSTGGQVALLAAALAACGAVGLVARGLAGGIERVVLAAGWRRWPAPLRWAANRRVARRRRRWDDASRHLDRLREKSARAAALRKPYDDDELSRAREAVHRIALTRPDRPTWSGDRVQAAAARLLRDHRIDFGLVWPHLWLTLAAPQQDEISAARDTLGRAALLGSWAVLYAPLAFMWWPAAPVALVVAVTAHHRFREAVQVYAQLLEAAVRVYTGPMASQLGIEFTGRLPADIGDQLTDLLGPVPPPDGDDHHGTARQMA
ncbi:hypothetical protein AB0E59_07810 [Lentzea sp. NPDC034063]|uniref:hypothetical protein n=1 Tax=unclassified Lentzea TaxID=2643253 RepID=UPI0033FCDA61